jgi:hypothetical protein
MPQENIRTVAWLREIHSARGLILGCTFAAISSAFARTKAVGSLNERPELVKGFTIVETWPQARMTDTLRVLPQRSRSMHPGERGP